MAPAVEMVIDRAVTAPVESAVPMAVAHLPTARSEAAAVVRSVNTVDEVRVTTTEEVFLVWGSVAVTVAVVPFTAVTGPDADANPPARNPPPPAGRSPDPPPGNSPPEPERRKPPAPPPAPPNPPVQEPDVGWEIVTVVAVTGSPNTGVVDDDDPLVGLPNAEIQEPTVTLEAVVVMVCSKVVVGV